MRKLLATLFMLSAICAGAQTQRVTATITVTNNTETGDAFVVNTDTRYWSNVTSASFIETNSAGGTNVSTVATNLFNAISLYSYAGPVVMQWSATNAIRLIGQMGQTLTVQATGEWASITYVTQSGPRTFAAIWPFDNLGYATNRTNQASDFAKGLSDYSTNAISPYTTLASNLISLITTQTVAGPKTWTGSNIFTGNVTMSNLLLRGSSSLSGTVGNFTNGYWTNAIFDNVTATNFRPRGAGTATILLGSDAGAFLPGDVAIGDYASANGGMGVAIGYGANTSSTNDVAIGAGSEVTGAYSTALGRQSGVGGRGTIAIGYSAVANGTNSILIGHNTTMTASNTVQIGSSSQSVNFPGVITVPVVTNAVLKGSNYLDGDLSMPAKTISSIADGPNIVALLGTNNVNFRLTGGASDASIAGLTGGRDGRIAIFENRVGADITLLHESGLDPTASDRLSSPTSSDIVIPDKSVFTLLYNSSDSRWLVANVFPTTPLVLGSMAIYDITNTYVLAAGTWLTITNYTATQVATNITASLATGTFTVQLPGWYRIAAHMSYSGKDVGGDNYEIAIKKGDGTASAYAEAYGAATSTDRHSSSCSTLAYLTNSEIVTLRVKSVAGDDVDVLGAQLNMELIRP